METNYDKVEQSNGGKSMRFFEYLKKQEPSKENEEARKRIYKLHQLEGSLTYIERMEVIEEGKGSMEVEFVRGELNEGMTLCFYDNQGKESGRGEILEIYIGKGEDKGRFSEQGNKGKIIFEYWQPVTDRFWNSQYLKEFTLEK